MTEPRAVDERHDESPLGIFDMAGNGREWTRDVLRPDGSIGPGSLGKSTASDLGVLRGRNFTLSRPLSYADLEYEDTVPQTQYRLRASQYTSFRVVIEVGD